MLSCQEVSQLVSESLDRDLSWWQRMQVRLHLLMCGLCSRFRRQMLLVRTAARQYLADPEAEPAGGGELSPEARERIKQALRAGPS